MNASVPNPVPWHELVKMLQAYASDDRHQDVAALIAGLVPSSTKDSKRFGDFFRACEERGVHVTPVNHYSPIPDIRSLTADVWDTPSDTRGVNMNDAGHLHLLRDIFPRFHAEYGQFPTSPTECPHVYHYGQHRFPGYDAPVLHCMVRHNQPRTVLEIGSGYSSFVSANAALINGHTRLVCVEPYPMEALRAGFPGLSSLIATPVEQVGLDMFTQLSANDILFIDTSHVAKCGGNVNFLFFEVLPRLNPGVIVHVHDIFLPREYPEVWVRDQLRFYNEQYLLHAFLLYNAAFEVLFGIRYAIERFPNELRAAFPETPAHRIDHYLAGTSFWMRRRSDS